MSKQEFVQALRQGRCDIVDDMLEQGYIPDPNSISIVCEKGNVDLLLKLLKYPMNLQEGLFMAIFYQHCHLLDHLYLAGVDINFQDDIGSTVINYVKDTVTCKWLLDMGAKQIVCSDGYSPLYNACCASKDIEVIKVLLSREDGVQSISQRTNYGRTCLYWACFNNNTELVELLLSYEQGIQTIPYTDEHGNTPLHWACTLRYVDIVNLLLRHDLGIQTINQRDNEGKTPMDKTNPAIQTLLRQALQTSAN